MQKQNKIFNTRSAFTLSEVLITLALMGTLMALTIPTLLQSTNKVAYVDGLKKTYGMLDSATSQIMMNNAGTLIGAFTSSDAIVTKYCSVLDCLKICTAGTAASEGCYNELSALKTLNDSTMEDPADPNISGFVLADGTLFITKNTETIPGTCNDSFLGVASICGFFNIDINGFAGPNTFGRDIFSFDITKNGLIPSGTIGARTNYATYCDPASSDASNGDGCSGRVLNEGAMNY